MARYTCVRSSSLPYTLTAQLSHSRILTDIIERNFPFLAERMHNNKAWHLKHTGFEPDFGLFWNLCVNAPSPQVGVERCISAPHADSKNVAALFCALLAFWADGALLPAPSSALC